jgi:putative spermidine/putrescine transport system substrate-binding protein
MHFYRTSDDVEPIDPARRQVLKSGLVAAGLLCVSSMPVAQSTRLDGKRVVYVSWGGVYQDSQKTAYCEPFMSETGAKVTQDGPMNEARLRTIVAGGKPEWDVCDVTDTFLFNGAVNGLFERIDYQVVDRKILAPSYAKEFGVGNCVWSYNVCYSTKAFHPGSAPRTWADLFDIKRFPGKRMFRNRVYSTLEIALMADGVDPKKLYPLDVDRALRKLDTIKSDITWWTTPSQSQQLITDGAVSCGVIQNGRAYDAWHKGAEIAIEWSQNLQSVDYLVILRGSANRDAAMQLLNRSIQPDAQAKFANATAYSPVNPNAFTQIDKGLLPWLSTEPKNAEQGITMDASWWQDKLETLDDKWNRWRLA